MPPKIGPKGFPTITRSEAISNGANLADTEMEGLDWSVDKVIYSEQGDSWRSLDYYQVIHLNKSE